MTPHPHPHHHVGEVLRWRSTRPVSLMRTAASCVGGTLTVTNYRLLFEATATKLTLSLPLTSIAQMQILATGWVEVVCRSPRVVYMQQTDGSYADQDAFCRKLRGLLPNAVDHLFAFTHCSQVWRGIVRSKTMVHALKSMLLFARAQQQPQTLVPATPLYSPERDFARFGLGGDATSKWTLSSANAHFALCPTYPRQLIVPAAAHETVLKAVAAFRAQGRLPVLTWKNPSGPAALLRSAQPGVGLFMNQRCTEDEVLLREVRAANERCKTLYVFDARSFTASFANKAKGGGYENTDVYRDVVLEFLNIANIHAVRDSFEGLVRACRSQAPDPRWSTAESSAWYAHLSSVLTGAQHVARALTEQHASCLVHCSDGWDRTSAIVSLAQLMVDPHYRTLHGFLELIDKDWVQFGHMFGRRLGQPTADGTPTDEQSPIFVQWLDMVYQMMLQQPTVFEFNEELLLEVAFHLTSSRFGTFLCNSELERQTKDIRKRTLCFWQHLLRSQDQYLNADYQRSTDSLAAMIQTNPRSLQLWEAFFLPHLRDVVSEHYLAARHDMWKQQAETMRRRKLLKACVSALAKYARERRELRKTAEAVVADIVEQIVSSACELVTTGTWTSLAAPGTASDAPAAATDSSDLSCSIQERLLGDDDGGFIVVGMPV